MVAEFLWKWAANTALLIVVATVVGLLFGVNAGNGLGVLALAGLALLTLGFIAEQVVLSFGDFRTRRPMAATIITATTVVMTLMVVFGVTWLTNPIREVAWQVWVIIPITVAAGAAQAWYGVAGHRRAG